MRATITDFLNRYRIAYQRYQHPPLEDCQAASRLGVERAGVAIKNLFLNDNYRRRHFLLLCRPHLSVDLKQLSKDIAVSRLGFASPRRLEHYLGVKPGHVSLLALCHPNAQAVELLVDSDLLAASAWQAHPGNNRETFVLQREDVDQFLSRTGHIMTPVAITELSEPA